MAVLCVPLPSCLKRSLKPWGKAGCCWGWEVAGNMQASRRMSVRVLCGRSSSRVGELHSSGASSCPSPAARWGPGREEARQSLRKGL